MSKDGLAISAGGRAELAFSLCAEKDLFVGLDRLAPALRAPSSPYGLALSELWGLTVHSKKARVAVGLFLAKAPFQLLVACPQTDPALRTEDSETVTKFVLEPSDLLLEIMAAARAADWDKIVVGLQVALSSYVARKGRARSVSDAA